MSMQVEELDGINHIVVIADEEIKRIISRLIPSAKRYPVLHFAAHPDNCRLLRMVLSEYNLEIKTPNAWKKCTDDIEAVDRLAIKLQKLRPVTPSKQNFMGKLMPFQKLGLDFLLKTDGRALLADEMGLGKTIQTLAYVAENPEAAPVVVVAPLVTLQNWKREIQKFLKLDISDPLIGDVTDTPRIQMIRSGKANLRRAEFYLVNYEMLYKQGHNLIGMEPHTVVFDEIQALRKTDTKKFKACSALSRAASVKHVIGLSGTPIYNRGIEMYGIADTIKPGVLGDRDEFITRYCTNYNLESTDNDKRVILADRLNRSIMLRRKKLDVLPDLPEKSRLQQNIQIDTELYEEKLSELYDRIEAAKNRLAGKLGADEKAGLFELNKMLREMRVAERQIAGLAKAPYVIEYIENILDDYPEEKFVIFCHHRSVHQVIYDALSKYPARQIIGGQSDAERQEAIDSFQTGGARVIICGLRAGNVGINLTSSSYVIFAELDWSPSIHRQAEDRLHRIGQKNAVFAHYLIGIDTFDEHLAQVLVEKTVEINSAMGDKMEALNNKQAIEMLEKRFRKKRSANLITEGLV